MILKVLEAATKAEEEEREELQVQRDASELREQIERMIQVNSKLSHDIKKNDFSLSHMVKNYEGRRAFLNTIELDINRAESYGKRLQKEFEREFETVVSCREILGEDDEEGLEDRVEGVKEGPCLEVTERGDGEPGEVTESKRLVEIVETKEEQGGGEKEKRSEKCVILSEELLSSSFTVSATSGPFGL